MGQIPAVPEALWRRGIPGHVEFTSIPPRELRVHAADMAAGPVNLVAVAAAGEGGGKGAHVGRNVIVPLVMRRGDQPVAGEAASERARQPIQREPRRHFGCPRLQPVACEPDRAAGGGGMFEDLAIARND